MKGVVIAGMGSGVGKTSITTGIMSELSRQKRVQPFKVGPDFIDPMYHTLACGRRSRNLDTFMGSKDVVRGIASHTSKDADLCIVEGVRGVYEGLTGTTDDGSTAEIAKTLGFPVILILDARSLGRSAAAMINGFRMFDPDVDIEGVILNNVSGPRHEEKLRSAIGKHCDIRVIGIVKHREHLELPSRHLGLATVDEGSKESVIGLRALTNDLDMDMLMDIVEGSDDRTYDTRRLYAEHDYSMTAAIPYDDAYCFYYRENIECMEAAGISVKTFSPLKGDHLPDADLYYIGGGYPELHAKEISENRDFLEGLNNAASEGKIVIGECGGLMTMCKSITGKDGIEHRMSGIFDGKAVMSGRHGPTYNIIHSRGKGLFEDMTIRGHEFHYSEIELGNDANFMFSVERGTGILDGMDGLTKNNAVASYTHQYALSTADWLKNVKKVID